ncbi:uncharacterized protein C12orf56 homolog isoform X1 [Anguilla anguilla]|uniref:uncharacterized protein C12orf56 homolog isoform X1 n=1 Tax=Anguilla anguilla TaxID=7936 RepID=UPI0015AD6615|nr:uncharacterized protein C12orf56 homolog isoform X1 [Anguilla anguilla]
MLDFMARTDTDGLQCSRNSKLDTFLRRNTERSVYDRIRAYEPCVVISETVNKVFMYVVLSDDTVYLAEYPPRTIRQAVSFRDVLDIELVNDLPDFLSGRDRELSQHIRVVYATAKHDGKKGGEKAGPRPRPSASPSPFHHSNRSVSPSSLQGLSSVLLSTQSAPSESVRWSATPSSLRSSREEEEGEYTLKQTRSASCPSPSLQGLRLPLPRSLSPQPLLSSSSSSSSLSSSPFPSCVSTSAVGPAPPNPGETGGAGESVRRGSVLSRLMRRVLVEKGGAEREETEAELHLYAVSVTSRIYLHLLSSWNSYMIRSTLMLDPLYRKRCSLNSSSLSQKQCQISSWERTACLFRQLSGELLQEGIGLESLYLLLQELHTAAHRNITVRKLFWRSSDLCPFLVKTLEEALKRFLDPANGDSRAQRADRLLLCTLVAETLSLMMREMEVEPARDHMLTAKRGALTEKLLLALVCDPEVVLQAPVGVEESGQTSVHAELQGLMGEFLDAATALLFEVVVLSQQASCTPNFGHTLTVGWVLKTLQSHSSTFPFVSHLTRQVISVLSGSQVVLSPAQSVLLYQRCRILMACLQHSTDLAQYIRTEFGEEFRYYVTMSWVEEKLPPQYPISQSTLRLISQLQHLVLREP